MEEKKINKEIDPQIDELVDAAAADASNADSSELGSSVPPTRSSMRSKAKKKGVEKIKELNKQKPSFRDLIDGSILTRDYVVSQLPILIFLAVLMMVYIANKYHSEKLAREIENIQKDIKELKCEKLSVQSELMSISKQSEVAKLIEEKGMDLMLLIEPPKKIVIEKSQIVENRK